MKETRAASAGFRSFWMAGFECSCQINSAGARLDMSEALGHDLHAADDYRRLSDVGMATARDGLRWHRIDRGGALDWSTWLPMLEAARRERVQVIWDLFHYGWPDDLDLFSGAFVDRFARFAGEAARVHREQTGEAGYFSPVNEISFFSWAAGRELMFPYAHGRDGEIKRQLVRANIAATEAIWEVTPEARLVSPEPLIHTVPPINRPCQTDAADRQNESQFEAWDMLSGRAAPELGGSERYLDIVGLNFYAANQWEVLGGRKLHWDAGSNDPRWMRLHKLIEGVYRRYGRPLFLAETSHYGIGRAPWVDEIAVECVETLRLGVPLEGVCLYPILDRFDWEDSQHWHNSGLWDMRPDSSGGYDRILNNTYAGALKRAQGIIRGKNV
uniref:Beta-glucosidase n=1 Tax=Solibacter usitatus (strain Ellin6076) TaxID=234267 RepID=Q02C54_SOLUE